MHVVDIRCRVSIRELSDLTPTYLRYLINCTVLGDCLEEGIDHRVWVSLSALDPETAMEEPCVSKHLPDNRMTPVVWLHLRVYCYSEVIVTGFQDLRDSQHLIKRDANKVRSKLLESCFKGSFIIFALAHGIAYDAISISYEKQHSSCIYSIKGSHICH